MSLIRLGCHTSESLIKVARRGRDRTALRRFAHPSRSSESLIRSESLSRSSESLIWALRRFSDLAVSSPGSHLHLGV